MVTASGSPTASDAREHDEAHLTGAQLQSHCRTRAARCAPKIILDALDAESRRLREVGKCDQPTSSSACTRTALPGLS